jgi:hypothetical protein
LDHIFAASYVDAQPPSSNKTNSKSTPKTNAMLASIMDPKFLFNKWLTLASHGERDLHSFEFNNHVNEKGLYCDILPDNQQDFVHSFKAQHG